MKTILFIDERNFISKIKSILNPEKEKEKEVDFFAREFFLSFCYGKMKVKGQTLKTL